MWSEIDGGIVWKMSPKLRQMPTKFKKKVLVWDIIFITYNIIKQYHMSKRAIFKTLNLCSCNERRCRAKMNFVSDCWLTDLYSVWLLYIITGGVDKIQDISQVLLWSCSQSLGLCFGGFDYNSSA